MMMCPALIEAGISAGFDEPVLTLGVFHIMSQKRKRLSGAEKIAIVKRYLVERVPISDLCDQHGVQPSRERAPEPWSSIREQVLMRHSDEPIWPSRQPVDGDRVASV